MFYSLIRERTRSWLASPDCQVTDIFSYIRKQGRLRQTQTEALETYLFLKIKGQNQPLWKLFVDGALTKDPENLDALNINANARDYLAENPAARALYSYADSCDWWAVKNAIINEPDAIDYEDLAKKIFYGVDYPDYLMSLPMGAGKTYLMAAMIYLDLYFADAEPDNPIFAKNFLVLIPNARKSSIAPSLKEIADFDGSMVFPAKTAHTIKKNINFTILDESKTEAKSMRTVNPNALRVRNAMKTGFGYIFVVNAEKVILDRFVGETSLGLWEKRKDIRERRANELRKCLGELPSVSLFIDEVHHAAEDDIKLRQVVNNWYKTGNIVTVLGFSGTPYLKKKKTIEITNDIKLTTVNISSTVYYYSLYDGVRNFLKTPKIKTGENMSRLEIIRQGVTDFRLEYGDKRYRDGTLAKLAIYCPTIHTLEAETYSYLTSEMEIPADMILKYHGGNKEYSLPEANRLSFRALDRPDSQHRYVLLVGIGREGWNCRSLTGVILSQEGDCPRNMVLQTCCRCLRQVDKDTGETETALIWLNKHNTDYLDKQLKQEQNTSIEQIQQVTTYKDNMIETRSRMKQLGMMQLPLRFYQLKISYTPKIAERPESPEDKLDRLYQSLDKLFRKKYIQQQELNNLGRGTLKEKTDISEDPVSLQLWIHRLSKESFALIPTAELRKYQKHLDKIFSKITTQRGHHIFFNTGYLLADINRRVRLCFHTKRRIEQQDKFKLKDAEILLVEKLRPVEASDNIYPDAKIAQHILKLDAGKKNYAQEKKEWEKSSDLLRQNGLTDQADALSSELSAMSSQSAELNFKDKTLHYIPYNFWQSGYEKKFIETCLRRKEFLDSGLEIYYNGERGLTDFVIGCYEKLGENEWKNLGNYTTDFLVLQRKNNKIAKVLMIETKGAVYSQDLDFQAKKKFIESIFIQKNSKKFDFLYLEERADGNMDRIIDSFLQKITAFF